MGATYPSGAYAVRGETLALSSTLASLGAPPNAYQVILYNPGTDFRLHVNPAIKAAYFFDASAAKGSRFKAETQNLTDRDTGTGTGSDMNSMTASDFLYMCFSDIVAGFRGTIGNANGTGGATTSGTYSKNDGTFAALTVTDGMASATSFDQTGSVTWTVPTDWKRGLLTDFGIARVDQPDVPYEEGFWMRLAVDITLGATVSITEAWALNRNTTRGYCRGGVEYALSLDRRIAGAFEAVLASGTDTLEVTWMLMGGV